MQLKSVIGIIFSKDREKILLTQRRDVPVWVLPGGGIENNEQPNDAMIREILEETGFHVKIKRCIGIYTPLNRLTKKTILYECQIVHGKKKINNETKNIDFFSLDSLPKIPPPFTDWIQDALQDGPVLHKKIHITYRLFFKYLISHPILIFRFLLSRLGYPLNT